MTSGKKEDSNSTGEIISQRSAGILLHITSLPSPFGIGDIGPEARLFADFLVRTGQKYWQILPLGPTDASPYSAISGMAGNTMLISPELLIENGWLDPDDVTPFKNKEFKTVNYKEAAQIKSTLLLKAYAMFQKNRLSSEFHSFKEFCLYEADWLDDFALYLLLQKLHNGDPWYKWPEAYKKRNKDALISLEGSNAGALEEMKWQQYIFAGQWKALKNYCSDRGIKLLGDIPIYVSYESADVWSNPGIFNMDADGNLVGVAGVPPDYFSEEGQLWGMPVFRWDVLKSQGYDWWMRRLHKNMTLYNLVRLDHFRAFANYWEVPADEQTAINGSWKTGPGSSFFKAVQKKLGKLPFIAEDLGEEDEAVYQLRDEFLLPGMKVLQFAFDKNMAESQHIPHNYDKNFVVYTGTHDNNTVTGWFRTEVQKNGQRRIAQYTGKRINEKNIHLIMASLAYSSVAGLCILPMQDILGIDETGRMNIPGKSNGNWLWRLEKGYATPQIERQLKNWVKMYNR